MKVLLPAEIGAQAEVRVDRRVDQHGLEAVLFSEVGGVEAAERRADEAGLSLEERADGLDRLARVRRQRGAGELRAERALLHEAPQDLRLVGERRRVKPVQINDQAVSRECRRSRRST